MPVAELTRAGQELLSGLAHLSPGIAHSMHPLDPESLEQSGR
jgi:hypothetical protein